MTGNTDTIRVGRKSTAASVRRARVEQLANQLDSNDFDKLLVAKDMLDAMGSEAGEVLQAILYRDAMMLRSYKRRTVALTAVTTLICLLFACITPLRLTLASTMTTFLMMFLLLGIGYDRRRSAAKRRLKNATTLLQRSPAPSAITALIEAMEVGDATTARLAEESLALLLPRLQAEDGTQLHTRHHACLHRALHGYNSTLIRAILQAFETVGDQRDVNPIKRLTACPVWIAENDHIRADARRCLAVIQERMEIRREEETLLRAPAVSISPETGLLQPAANNPPIEASFLLRPPA